MELLVERLVDELVEDDSDEALLWLVVELEELLELEDSVELLDCELADDVEDDDSEKSSDDAELWD